MVADALSRLELTSEPMEDLFFTEELRSEFYCYGIEDMGSDDYPMTYESIGKAQASDKDILKENGTNRGGECNMHTSRRAKTRRKPTNV